MKEKELCYYYNDKYTPTHRCKVSCLLLVGEEEMEEILKGKEVQQPEEQPFREEKEILEISLIAIEGHYHPTTLRMQGTCKDQNLVILIDGGSTHNFIKRLVAD